VSAPEPARPGPNLAPEGEPLEKYSTYFILWGFLLAGSLFLYWKILEAPFLFDDIYLIFKLGSILEAPRLADLLSYNRPLVLLSYVANYFFGGIDPYGYHLLQVLLHGSNALLVFALTLSLGRMFQPAPARPGRAFWLGTAAGLVYLAHPLLSMAVVLVSGRSELLCAFFYLLGLVLFVRDQRAPGPCGWLPVCLAYFAAILSKETAITFPAAVLLIQWLAGTTPWKSVRENPKLYGLLAVLSVGLLAKVGLFEYGQTVGGTALPFNRWEYLLTQVTVLVHGLKVFLAPLPEWLCVDWDYPIVRRLTDPLLLRSAAIWLACGLGVWLAWRRRWRLAVFAAVMYPLAAAPTSRLIPIADPLMEYRFYLPCAFLAILLAALPFQLPGPPEGQTAWRRGLLGAKLAAILAFILFLGWNLDQRLGVYQTSETFWLDAVLKSPHKVRPRFNLADFYFSGGEYRKALIHYEYARRQDPTNTDILGQMGDIYRDLDDPETAFRYYQQAHDLRPRSSEVANRICALLLSQGQIAEAGRILDQMPEQSKDAIYYQNMATYLSRQGRPDEAAAFYREVLKREPHSIVALTNLGNLYRQAGRLAEAEECYRRAIAVQPKYILAQFNLGQLYFQTGRLEEAQRVFELCLETNPAFPWTYLELGNYHAMRRDYRAARANYRSFLDRQADHADGWFRLGLVEQELGRPEEARRCFERTLDLAPGHAGAREALGAGSAGPPPGKASARP